MPLALILAHCERLASTLVDRDQLASIDEIRNELSRMSRQIDGLLQATATARVPVDVAALADEVVARFRPLAQARGREITLDRPAGSAVILASPPDVELALQNVVDNALRNARSAPVHVAVRAGPRHVSIDVADDGPGIPSSERGAVLRVRTQGADATQGGAGLGLSITNAVVQAHGGRVRISEASQGGALVSLQLPTPGTRPRPRRRRATPQVGSRA